MDITSILGSVSGGVLGFIGSIASDFVGVYKAKAQHKMDMERMEFQSKLTLQQADLALRQTQEEQSGQAFSKAIDAQSALTGSSGWVKDVLSLWRPGLTAYLLTVSTGIALWRGGDALDLTISTFVNTAAAALGYWFGQRTADKVQIRIAARSVATAAAK